MMHQKLIGYNGISARQNYHKCYRVSNIPKGYGALTFSTLNSAQTKERVHGNLQWMNLKYTGQYFRQYSMDLNIRVLFTELADVLRGDMWQGLVMLMDTQSGYNFRSWMLC